MNWRNIPNTYKCNASGLLRRSLDKKIGYKKVITSKKFRFACDFSISQTNGSTTRVKKSLKTYGVLDKTPTKEQLMAAKNCYELIPGNTIIIMQELY